MPTVLLLFEGLHGCELSECGRPTYTSTTADHVLYQQSKSMNNLLLTYDVWQPYGRETLSIELADHESGPPPIKVIRHRRSALLTAPYSARPTDDPSIPYLLET